MKKGIDWDVAGKDIWVAKGLFATFRLTLVPSDAGGDGARSSNGTDFGAGSLSDHSGLEEKDAGGAEDHTDHLPPTKQELELLDMGFPQVLVRQALKSHGFNKDAA